MPDPGADLSLRGEGQVGSIRVVSRGRTRSSLQGPACSPSKGLVPVWLLDGLGRVDDRDTSSVWRRGGAPHTCIWKRCQSHDRAFVVPNQPPRRTSITDRVISSMSPWAQCRRNSLLTRPRRLEHSRLAFWHAACSYASSIVRGRSTLYGTDSNAPGDAITRQRTREVSRFHAKGFRRMPVSAPAAVAA